MSSIEELARAFTRAAASGSRAAAIPAPSRTYREDPTVAETAAEETARLWARISRKVEAGVWFYRAREQVLAEEIRDIGTAYGAPVAKRVERAVQHMESARVSPAARCAVEAGNRTAVEAYLRARDPRRRIGLVNRISLALLGRHFW